MSGALHQTSNTDNFDDFADLQAVLVQTLRKNRGRAPVPAMPQGLPPELQARIAASHALASGTRPLPYEEWRTIARVAVFIDYTCTCGHHLRTFSHYAFKQLHHRLSSHRIAREVSPGSMPMSPLPKDVVVYSRSAELCSECAPRKGFNSVDAEPVVIVIVPTPGASQ